MFCLLCFLVYHHSYIRSSTWVRYIKFRFFNEFGWCENNLMGLKTVRNSYSVVHNNSERFKDFSSTLSVGMCSESVDRNDFRRQQITPTGIRSESSGTLTQMPTYTTYTSQRPTFFAANDENAKFEWRAICHGNANLSTIISRWIELHDVPVYSVGITARG